MKKGEQPKITQEGAFQKVQKLNSHSREWKQVMELQLAERSGKILQVGQICTFVFHFTTGQFIHIDEQLAALTLAPFTEYMDKSVFFFLDCFVIPAQLTPVRHLFKKSVDVLKKSTPPYPVVNLDCTIAYNRNKTKRILLQYSLFPRMDQQSAQLAYGKLVDISHLKKEGVPRLQVMRENKIVFTAEASREEMLQSSAINLTMKDLAVLSLQSRGLRAREIAQKLHMSELSIYSLVRDMKRKTKMETLPLMQMLRQKGLLD